jgi:predicted SAM-dependent methyltransferase
MKRILRAMFSYLGIPIYWLRQCASEASAAYVRIWAALPIQRYRVKSLLKRDAVWINFGCGETSRPGWIGVDRYFASNVDIVLDLRRALPLPDSSVDLCYSEHVLEHLTPEEGQSHLGEVFRILKPGGIYRVVVPDVIEFVRRYIEGDRAFFSLAFPWAERPMQAIYAVANWNGEHRNILDLSELRVMGERAGFAQIERSEAQSSAVEDLRIDTSDPQRVAESLYVELFKAPVNASSTH